MLEKIHDKREKFYFLRFIVADTDNQAASYTVGNNLLEWREVEGGQLPEPRVALHASMVDNMIFVTGGSLVYPNINLTSILFWDPSTESWQKAGDLKVGRNSHAAVAVPSSIIESECSAILSI